MHFYVRSAYVRRCVAWYVAGGMVLHKDMERRKIRVKASSKEACPSDMSVQYGVRIHDHDGCAHVRHVLLVLTPRPEKASADTWSIAQGAMKGLCYHAQRTRAHTMLVES